MFNVNEYFAGKVKSLSFQSDENKATLGVIAAVNMNLAPPR